MNAARSFDPVVVVDLQALHFAGIRRADEDGLVIGATVTLQRLAGDAGAPAAIREAATREQPSALREMATVGGCVAAADPSSELLAGLLVHGGKVSLVGRDGEHSLDLAALLADGSPLAGRIITAVAIETGGVTNGRPGGRTSCNGRPCWQMTYAWHAGDLCHLQAKVANVPCWPWTQWCKCRVSSSASGR